MKHFSIWYALTLTVSALLLNGAKGAHTQSPSPRETPKQAERAYAAQAGSKRNQQAAQQTSSSQNQIGTAAASQPTATNTAESPSEKYEKAVAVSSVIQAICAGLLVIITFLLWLANRGMNAATQQAAQAARQSARAAELALNIERPYLFVEEQKVGMYLRVTIESLTDFVGEPKPTPDVSFDPETFTGRDKSNRADVRLDFNLKNRGKGVAILRSIRVRMLVGQGLEEEKIRLTTIGRED